MTDKHIKVLDYGYVELIDSMGSDQRIVDAARVSIAGDEVKSSSTNRQLIRYLLRHKHTSPFEMIRFTFAVKLPIMIARQWMRHRMGSFNEMSARYGVLPEEFYVPVDERLNLQALDNHQGSGEELVSDPAYVSAIMRESSKLSFENYHELLNTGLSRELARNVVPVNTYTKFYWTVDLWNLMHFLRLRLDGHAQAEIRAYGEALFQLVEPIVPLAMGAFDDYILQACSFSRMEMDVIKHYLKHAQIYGPMLEKDLGSKREVTEFLAKLNLTEGDLI